MRPSDHDKLHTNYANDYSHKGQLRVNSGSRNWSNPESELEGPTPSKKKNKDAGGEIMGFNIEHIRLL